MGEPFARGGGVSVSADDLVLALKLGSDRSLLESIIARKVAAAGARAAGLAVTDEEVDDRLATYYAELELFEDDHIAAWLNRVHASEELVRRYVEELLLGERLEQHLAQDAVVEERYEATRYDHATVAVEIITVDFAGAAAELALGVRERERTWTSAAERAGGFESRTLRRSEASEEIAADLFSATPGQIVGPVETDEGRYALYRVLSKTDPILDDELRERIRTELFTEELGKATAKDAIRFL